MYNWNTDEAAFKKKFPAKYRLWRLTQLINYGLDGDILNQTELKAAWPKIKDQLDPDKRKTLEWLVWDKPWHPEPGLRPDRSNFWQWFWKNHSSSKPSI